MRDVEFLAPAGQLFIGGRWCAAASGQLADAENPADETTLRQVAWGDAQDVDRAVAAAADAAYGWAATPWSDRASALREVAARLRADLDRLALIDTLDSGNTLASSRRDVQTAARVLEYFAGLGGELKGSTIPGQAGTFTFTRRRPYGVVGRILAYNHPLLFAVQGMAAPLAAGNTVVLKPADHTCLSALEIAAIVADILPAGALSVVTGAGHTAGTALVDHPGVPRIAFTGSVATGRRVLEAAARHIKHVTLELGGKNPLVIFPDVEVQAAADAAVRGMNLTSTNGQSCQSTSRVLVHTSVRDAVVEAIATRYERLVVGRPEDPGVDVGPLTFKAHHDRVMAAIAAAQRDGARLVTGGKRPPGLTHGHFVEPTLFTEVTPEMAVARDEIFGPVQAVLSWTDQEEMIQLANGTPYGLTANVLTSNLTDALTAVERVEAGLVWVNGPTPRPLGTPFGGVKQSGLGRETGLDELLSYTVEQSVVVRC